MAAGHGRPVQAHLAHPGKVIPTQQEIQRYNWGCSDRNCSGRKVCHVEIEGKTDAVEQRTSNFFKTVLPFWKLQFNVSLAIAAPSLEFSTLCLIILG